MEMEGPEKQTNGWNEKQKGPLCFLAYEWGYRAVSVAGKTGKWGALEKREHKGSVLENEQETRSFLQEEKGKETVPEGGQVREKLKRQEGNLMKQLI